MPVAEILVEEASSSSSENVEEEAEEEEAFLRFFDARFSFAFVFVEPREREILVVDFLLAEEAVGGVVVGGAEASGFSAACFARHAARRSAFETMGGVEETAKLSEMGFVWVVKSRFFAEWRLYRSNW